MKRFWLAIAFVAAPAVAGAQATPATATASINAKATVQSAVTVTPGDSLDFGIVTPGTDAVVAPANGGNARVDFNTSTTVTVAGTALSDAVSGATLPVTYACAQDAVAGSAAPTAFTCSTGQAYTYSGTTMMSRYIYVGGTILGTDAAAVPAGQYRGTVTFTASYNRY